MSAPLNAQTSAREPQRLQADAGIALRPYQQRGDAAITHELETRGLRATLLVQATGTGKTLAFLARTLRCKSHGGRTLILADRDELIRQPRRKLEALGVYADVEKARERASLNAKVVIASVQSLRGARLARFPRDHFDLVIADEADLSMAPTWRAILDHFATAKVLGVTATPIRADGQALGEVYESVAFRYEIRDAIRDGYLVPIQARRVVLDGVDLSSVKTRAGDLAQDQLAELLETERAISGVVVPLLELARDRPTVVFGVDVAHAELLAAALNERRPGCARAVSGDTAEDERRGTLEAYERREFQFLANCLDEDTEILADRGWVGIDSIAPDELVATMSTATSALEWQRIQRVVRRPRAPGEQMVRITNQTLDVRVTAGHRMVIGVGLPQHWGIADAETLPPRRSPYTLPVAAFGEPERRLALALDECRFIGLWITDGNLGKYRRLIISQSQRFADSNNEIVRILDSCGFDWTRSVASAPKTRHLQNRYGVPHGSRGGKLARRGYARLEKYLDKDMPTELLDLDREQSRAFFEGLWLGDGVKHRSRKHRNSTRRSWDIVNTNRTLLERVQRLAVTRGFGANLSRPRDNGPLSTKPIYTLRIRDRAVVRTNNRHVATSGGNPAHYENENNGERVWCVSTPNGTIITRRRGKVLVMGQCALLCRGWDAPLTSCVAIVRPTKSWALFVQMAGRGTRPSPATGKRDLLLLNFTGTAGRHRLVGPADCLAGSEHALDALPDDVRDEIDRLLGTQQLELDAVIASATAEVEQRRAAIARDAIVRFHAEEIDPFLGDADHAAALHGQSVIDPRWASQRPTEKQLKALEKQGVTLSKLPPSFSMADASRLLGRLAARRSRGLCSLAQARRIARGTGIDARAITFERATQLCTKLRLGGWRPHALAGEPEYIAAANARPHDLERLGRADHEAAP